MHTVTLRGKVPHFSGKRESQIGLSQNSTEIAFLHSMKAKEIAYQTNM